jgi:hypothetical protein
MNAPPPLAVYMGLKQSGLDLISLGLYVINLCFSDSTRLTIYAPFRFGKNSSIISEAIQDFPLERCDLVRLLGHTVTELNCDTDGTLDLIFSNDYRLIIYANDPMYEAYLLFVEGTEYII